MWCELWYMLFQFSILLTEKGFNFAVDSLRIVHSRLDESFFHFINHTRITLSFTDAAYSIAALFFSLYNVRICTQAADRRSFVIHAEFNMNWRWLQSRPFLWIQALVTQFAHVLSWEINELLIRLKLNLRYVSFCHFFHWNIEQCHEKEDIFEY